MLRDRNIKWLAVMASVVFAACSYGGEDGAMPAPGNNGSEDDEQRYAIGVSADSGLPATTRAEYDGVTYKWSPGDEAGFYMVPMGGGVPTVANSRLESMNREPRQFTEFDGELTFTEIKAMDPEARYDYYSYFPYGEAADVGFPNVAFNIPSEITLTPGVFPAQYGFMYATPETTAEGARPLTWLEDGQQKFGEKVGFRYNHAFAYLEVYLALNLMSQPVGKIVVTCTDGALSGTANIDLRNGAVNFPSGSNSLTINVAGGMDIRSATDYDRIWIPINPALASKEFRFDFYSAVDARNVASQTVSGKPLQAGMKHKAGFKLPFYINFTDLTTRDDSWTMSSFSHRGYPFWCWRVNTKETSAYLNGAAISFGNHDGWNVFNECRGQIRTQALSLINSLSTADIPVRVTITATGNAPETKTIRYGASGQNKTSFESGDFDGNFTISINSARSYSFNTTLSQLEPALVLEGATWGAYWIFIQEITIEYAGT